jgi:hypothetical protein
LPDDVILSSDLVSSSRDLESARTDSSRIESGDLPKVGDWFWVKHGEDGEDGERRGDSWLGAVVEVGSNYFKLHGIDDEYSSRQTCRVHVDDFWSTCEREPDASAIITRKVEEHRIEVRRLMGEVQALTARLHVSPRGQIASADDTRALAVRTGAGEVESYKRALIEAKKKTLPDLFKLIDDESKKMAGWMRAGLIPLEAEAGAMRGALDVIEDRIFSVELYAGLTETVKRVRRGKLAGPDEKVHLMQRRFYMDEECLARYEAGGIEIKDIEEFDEWLGRRGNMDRILPFPKCVVAFQVRRNVKDREVLSIPGLFEVMSAKRGDEMTYLYIRNGEALFRLNTAIEFGPTLFPDIDAKLAHRGKLWAKMWSSEVKEVITDERYQEIVEDRARRAAEYDALPKKEKERRHDPRDDHHFKDYVAYTPDTVYYDDITKHVADEVKRHNRIVLVLQGLLDRSPVFHPHPPWQIWTEAGFSSALVLHLDDSRALPAGELPSFEDYRKRCNVLLRPGSVTVGQEDVWMQLEALREADRMRRSRFFSGTTHMPTPRRYRPEGNPGPGKIAKVASYARSSSSCTFVWSKERRGRQWGSSATSVECRLKVSSDRLLNVDAYRPGDFHIFYDDPRTRAEYLDWAPLLLEAEECHAGNRQHRPNKVTDDERRAAERRMQRELSRPPRPPKPKEKSR